MASCSMEIRAGLQPARLSKTPTETACCLTEGTVMDFNVTIAKMQKVETGEWTVQIVSCAAISYPEQRRRLALENFIKHILSYGFFMSAVYMLKRNP